MTCKLIVIYILEKQMWERGENGASQIKRHVVYD